MNTAANGRPRGNLRVGDADRDRALADLSRHFTEGRINAEELDERTGQALQARTVAELALPMADLPRLPAAWPSRPTGPGALSGPGGLAGPGTAGAGPIMGAGPGARTPHVPFALLVLAVPIVVVTFAVLAIGLGHHAMIIPFPLTAIAIIVQLVRGRS